MAIDLEQDSGDDPLSMKLFISLGLYPSFNHQLAQYFAY
jgi:hypothetical protein